MSKTGKTIMISEEIRDRLKTAGNMDDTYNRVILRALDCLEKEKAEQYRQDDDRLNDIERRLENLEHRFDRMLDAMAEPVTNSAPPTVKTVGIQAEEV